MSDVVFHHLDTSSWGVFDHLAVSGERVRLSINNHTVTFNLRTAEQLIDILGGYCEDSRRARQDYYSEIDRIRDSITSKENGNGI